MTQQSTQHVESVKSYFHEAITHFFLHFKIKYGIIANHINAKTIQSWSEDFLRITERRVYLRSFFSSTMTSLPTSDLKNE